MDKKDLGAVLGRIRGIRHACDLDLLLFFYRHPRALLTGERLVAVLGYEREQVAKSLDGLIDAGLLTRSQNPSHAARLYVLELGGIHGGPLTGLLEIAATREGRRELLRLLQPGPNHVTSAAVQRAPLAKVA
jgi:hypothetical protein